MTSTLLGLLLCLLVMHTPWKLATHWRRAGGGGPSYRRPTQMPNRLTPPHRFTPNGQAGWPGPLQGAREMVAAASATPACQEVASSAWRTAAAEMLNFIFSGLVWCEQVGGSSVWLIILVASGVEKVEEVEVGKEKAGVQVYIQGLAGERLKRCPGY